MTVTKTTVKEKKLLEESRENYRLLKEQFLILQEENQKLASLRDTLLPKLMSGEIDVSSIQL